MGNIATSVASSLSVVSFVDVFIAMLPGTLLLYLYLCLCLYLYYLHEKSPSGKFIGELITIWKQCYHVSIYRCIDIGIMKKKKSLRCELNNCPCVGKK